MISRFNKANIFKLEKQQTWTSCKRANYPNNVSITSKYDLQILDGAGPFLYRIACPGAGHYIRDKICAVLLCSVLLLLPFHLRFIACALVHYFELCSMPPHTMQCFTSADGLNISYFLQSFSCFCTLQTVSVYGLKHTAPCGTTVLWCLTSQSVQLTLICC